MEKNNRRSLKNLLINPAAQMRYGTLYLGVAILVHAVTTLLVIRLQILYQSEGFDSASFPLSAVAAMIFFAYAVLYGFAFFLGLLISHRLYGPLVNFSKHVNQWNQGNFADRILLRKNDDEKLKEFAEQLNQLADKLQKR